MNIAVVGATWATKHCVEGLRRHGYTPVVFGQRPSGKIAGWADLNPDVWFDKIVELRAEFVRFDVVFAVGFSQLVPPQLLTFPRLGWVGFHPTRLPRGRGRAPVAWLVLGEADGAATFFQLDNGTDSGPIFVQEPFDVGPDDYAINVCMRIQAAMDVALDRWLPHLEEWSPVPQDPLQASYLGVRKPEDGRIDWNQPSYLVQQLVRASSEPHPGAFTDHVRVWRATCVHAAYRGVIGRVLGFDEVGRPYVQTGDGILRLDDYDTPEELRVGQSL